MNRTLAQSSHYKPVKCEQIMENNIGTDHGETPKNMMLLRLQKNQYRQELDDQTMRSCSAILRVQT